MSRKLRKREENCFNFTHVYVFSLILPHDFFLSPRLLVKKRKKKKLFNAHHALQNVCIEMYLWKKQFSYYVSHWNLYLSVWFAQMKKEESEPAFYTQKKTTFIYTHISKTFIKSL